MIEYYTFKHRGDALDYQDEVFLRLVPSLTVAIFFGSNLAIAPKSQALLFSEILNSEEGGRSIDFLSADFDECLDEESEYLILRVLDNGVECYRRGGVYAKIIKDGQIKVLPNGFFGMSKDDKIVVGTAKFFKFLTDEGVLADALVYKLNEKLTLDEHHVHIEAAGTCYIAVDKHINNLALAVE